MKVLITSGGTTEFIDEVRVLTNTSTGQLGAVIAEVFDGFCEQITYVSSKHAVHPIVRESPFEQCAVTDVASLMTVMEKLVPIHDLIIHAMAVSDFGFKKSGIKLKSSSTEDFVDHLSKTIHKNPKVISHIKEWNPKCRLVGFKLEVGKTHAELIEIAHQSMLRNHADLMVANDKIEMDQANEHVAHVFDRSKRVITARGKTEIAEAILRFARNQ
jgi:phosphopantothenate--cysteine ligase